MPKEYMNGTISALLCRMLQCSRNNKLYVSENVKLFTDLYLSNGITIIEKDELHDQVIFLIRTSKNRNDINKLIQQYENDNIIVVLNEDECFDKGYKITSDAAGNTLSFYGPCFKQPEGYVPESFRVLAIIHVFNEADVIKKTTEYLLGQGVDVFLVDNWSTDDSYEIIQKLAYDYKGRVFCRRFPEDGPTDYYDWYHQLKLTENISREADYSWYIHYDADEYRIPPWKNVTLREAIYYIDSLGYNVIENTVIDFKVTEDNGESIFMKDTWFDFGHRPSHFEQSKTWKKCNSIDLKSSGGHIARVDNPRIFPLKFLNRHYPLRSLEHGKKKIFTDRKPRFVVENQKRGWHVHYNKIVNAEDIIASKDTLLLWNENTFEEYYIQLFTGCGIEVERKIKPLCIEALGLDAGKPVSIYGAGRRGKALYDCLADKYIIDAWVDRDYARIEPMRGRYIEKPDVLMHSQSQIVIAIKKEEIAMQIRSELLSMGISDRRIIWKNLSIEK